MIEATGAEAGLDGDQQILIALQVIMKHGGIAPISQIYDGVDKKLEPNGFVLSTQGKASLRYFVNSKAVKQGLVQPHDPNDPDWKITQEGIRYLHNHSNAPLVSLKQTDFEDNDDAFEIGHNLDDARKRISASIVYRQGQASFRSGLMEVYGGQCPITGCDAVDALEAAHIIPYLGAKTNVLTNGLLLRADVHTLFDKGLIAVRPSDWKVVVADKIRGTVYQELAGRDFRLPDDKRYWPSVEGLELRVWELV
ncbi:MAG TPA: HNH endonuclease [Anaerolineae bacterium]|nr:HNH endonuclease [Anaerolineae bacterium]